MVMIIYQSINMTHTIIHFQVNNTFMSDIWYVFSYIFNTFLENENKNITITILSCKKKLPAQIMKWHSDPLSHRAAKINLFYFNHFTEDVILK